MTFFRFLLPLTLSAAFFLLLPEAQATDFSANPFADSERALTNSRSATTFLNLSTKSQPESPTNIIIRQSPFQRAVDDTTDRADLINPYNLGFGRSLGFGYRVGFNPMTTGFASSAPVFGGSFSPFAFGPRLGGWGSWGGFSPGGFGNWMGFDEPGDMGSLGYVFNSTPSKASGNYYAPSTKDSSASGNYYASDSPAINMPIKPYTTPKDYWGSSGSPLPKDINKVPW